MPLAVNYIAFTVIGVGGLCFIVYELRIMARTKAANFNKTAASSKNANLFDGITFALNEMNKMGEEQDAIMKKAGIADAVRAEILKPVRGRYDKLKWVKEHEGIVMPLIEGGQKLIGNLVKGLF
jgi:hypothetical protein